MTRDEMLTAIADGRVTYQGKKVTDINQLPPDQRGSVPRPVPAAPAPRKGAKR